MLDFLYEHVWAAVALWLFVYACDYGLTIWGAKEYRGGPSEVVVFEGSYELNPIFQKDVDALRLFPLRFWLMGALYSVLIGILWLATRGPGGRFWFEFALGGVVLANATMCFNHINNIAQFRALRRGRAFEGKMEYSRRYLESRAGVSMMAFGLIYLFLAVVLSSTFALGGGLTLTLLGLRFRAGLPRKGDTDAKIREEVRGNLHPAAWHPDPRERHGYRYWDGERWTSHVADDGVASEDPY